jgi:phenylpropionate dioxygenase-like ring-hydroxylating dioxygenase large terminal subunit
MKENPMPMNFDALIDDRPQDGVFRVHADIFRREDIYELEMKHIFEGGWVFVGLDCQAAKPDDFFTTFIGRQPVIVMRDSSGKLGCFFNACRHRGAMVCQVNAGTRKHHVCPYHGWSYDSAGRNVAIPAQAEGGYTPAFAREDHNLRPVARFGNYRGFLFASLNPEVPPLDEHLGDSRAFIDLVVDQGDNGLEIVPGAVTYTYSGNWKLQIENSADAYHFVPTHLSYIQLLGKRQSAAAAARPSYLSNFREVDANRGSFCFANGHNVLWGANENIEARPLYLDLERVKQRVGEARTKWMFYTRNLLVFPNLQLLENASLQIRVNRPLGAGKTEITTYCIAPKGETREARTRRIRQYEEFFNPSGLATPDDTTLFEDCHAAQKSSWIDWQQGYMRGLAAVGSGTNKDAQELGVMPATSISSTAGICDETIFHGPLREWRRRLEHAAGAQGLAGAAE